MAKKPSTPKTVETLTHEDPACTAIRLTEPIIREKWDFVDVEFYRPVSNTNEKAPDTPKMVPSRMITPDYARSITTGTGGSSLPERSTFNS